MPSSPPYIVDGKTDAERYLEGCLDDSIVSCKKIKRLAEMLLPRFHDEYHGFHFSEEAALRPVRFIETMCRIPSAENMGMPFIMEPYERMIVECAFGFVDEDEYRQYREVLVEIGRKNGKALSLDTEVATPLGWRRIGDVHTGDYVFGQDGKPSLVIAESDVFHDKPVFLVTFEDGSKVKATHDHIWTVRRPGDEWHDVTTADIADEVCDGVEYEVPLCAPVEYPEAELDVDPYEMGVRCAMEGVEIPAAYLTASVGQREALFDGIVGVLGHRVFRNLPTYLYVHTGNEALMAQVQELASSLGVSWSLCDGCPGTMEIYTPGDGGKLISSIVRVPNEPTKCIAIDNESHLYLAGRQYTATHNTSLLAALNLYMLTSDREPAAECYNGATNTQQARLCFGATNDMVKMSPMLRKRIRRGMVQKRGISGLNFDKNSSFLCTISSRSDSLDGLNMHFGVLDELGACRDQGATYRLLTGAMSSRRQPMLFVISTQGKVRNNIFDNRLEVCNKILDGTSQSDRVLPVLFEQDSREEVFAGLDEEFRYLWKKSNPGLGTVKKESSMVELVQQAFENKADLPEVLMKQFNIPALEYSSFLSFEEAVNNTPVPFDPSIDRYCVVGFDLASKGDLNAAVALYRRPGDDNFYERSCFWIADEQVNINTHGFKERDAVPYRQWASEGWLNIVEGDKVNQMVIIEWLRSLVDDGLYPFAVSYDAWHVDDWTERELKRLVGENRAKPVPQYARILSPLMKEHKLDLRAGRIVNDSPVTHWNRMNVEVSTDNLNNIMPRKKGLLPQNKIDGYMAEIFAFSAYKQFEEEYLSIIGWEQTD